MAGGAIDAGVFCAMASHAPAHRDIGFAKQALPLRYRPVAILALRAAIEMRFVAEDHISRNLINSYPIDFPIRICVGRQFLNCRTIFFDGGVALHTL